MKKIIALLVISVLTTLLTYFIPYKSEPFSCSDVPILDGGQYSNCQDTVRGIPLAYWYSETQGQDRGREIFLNSQTRILRIFLIDSVANFIFIGFFYLLIRVIGKGVKLIKI